MNPPNSPNKQQAARASARTDRGASLRDDRLKAALKANLARRKAQARARAAVDAEVELPDAKLSGAGLSEAGMHDSPPQGAPDHD